MRRSEMQQGVQGVLDKTNEIAMVQTKKSMNTILRGSICGCRRPGRTRDQDTDRNRDLGKDQSRVIRCCVVGSTLPLSLLGGGLCIVCSIQGWSRGGWEEVCEGG